MRFPPGDPITQMTPPADASVASAPPSYDEIFHPGDPWRPSAPVVEEPLPARDGDEETLCSRLVAFLARLFAP